MPAWLTAVSVAAHAHRSGDAPSVECAKSTNGPPDVRARLLAGRPLYRLGMRIAPSSWHRAVIAPTLAVVVALLAALGAAPAQARAATAPTIYVDGKTGSDTGNDGRSPASAFATVKRGMWELRYGGHLEVVGYDDYVYYEKMTASQWFVNGSASSPIVIEAAGYGTAGYVRPIISGSLVVNRPGSSRWSRPSASAYPDVWATSWTVPIVGYEASVRSLRQERVFVDTSQPLRRPSDKPSLAELQAAPGSEYWDGRTLYVRLGGWGAPAGASSSTNPNDHAIDIPNYKGLLVASGSAYVTIRGFRIRHTTMGVGFTGSSTHGTVEDVDASYNNPMGFFTAGSYHTFRQISGSRNTIQLVKLDNGANHNLIDGAVGIENLGQAIKLTGSRTSQNTIKNSTFSGGRDVPVLAGQYGGQIQGVDIEQGAHDNMIEHNSISNMRRGLMLYQVNSAGGPLNGNVVKYNFFDHNDVAVLIWDGKYSSAAGSGTVRFYRNTYTYNHKAVMTESRTSHKVFARETIYRTGTAKKVGHSAFYLKAGTITVRNTIVWGTKGYAFYAKRGAIANVKYSTVQGALGKRNSRSRVRFGAGVVRKAPGWLSVDQLSKDYLYLGRGSAAYYLSSTHGPVGARWR